MRRKIRYDESCDIKIAWRRKKKLKKYTAVAFLILFVLGLALTGCSPNAANGSSDSAVKSAIKFMPAASGSASDTFDPQAFIKSKSTPAPTEEPTPEPAYTDPPYVPGNQVYNITSIRFEKRLVYFDENTANNIPNIIIEPSYATYRSIAVTSSDPSVVRYDPSDYLLHTGSAGIATITATSYNNSVTTCTVVVSKNPGPVTDIRILNGTSDVIRAGTNYNIGLTVKPDGARNFIITWVSSNPAVAQIYYSDNSNCAISALAIGESTITVTSDSGVSVTFHLTVIAPATPTPAPTPTPVPTTIPLQI